jgi:hypothetical protein
MKLNGVLVTLQVAGEPQNGAARFSATGTTVSVRPLGDDADWRQSSELVLRA